MARSYIEYTGDGVTTNFAVPFSYISETHVHAAVDGDETAFTWINSGTIQISPAPTSGAFIKIYRETSPDARLVDYNVPGTLTEEDLDTDSLQAFFLAQEAVDTAKAAMGPSIESGHWDGKGLRLTNLADPVGPQDAMTYAAAQQAVADAQEGASAAAASAAAALASELAAAASEAAAAASELSAASSAAAAAASADAVIWQNVTFLSVADSPFDVTNAQRGHMLVVDASGGPVTINLPSIASLSLVDPFVIGVKKSDASGNAITIAANGSDTIDAGATKQIASPGSGTTLIPDTDPNPDRWVSADFGASAGNLSIDNFVGDGSDTSFDLSVDPVTENNTFVFIDGVYQSKNVYSVSGATLVFSEAPPPGASIQVVIGSTLPIGTPADGTVTPEKVADGFALVPAGAMVEYGGETAPDGWLLCDGAEYDVVDQPRLFAVIGYRFGGSGSKFQVPDRVDTHIIKT